MRSTYISRRRIPNHTPNNCLPWPRITSLNPSSYLSRLRTRSPNI